MAQQFAANAIPAKIDALIDRTRRFPQKVFLGAWSSFFFFDSDWIFSVEFVAWIKSLLRTEGGTCACIINLDAGPNGGRPSPPAAFIIDTDTSSEECQRFLAGSSTNLGWIDTADRFACASNHGDWCIYCEKGNEVAVIALRSDALRTLVDEVKAKPIAEAIGLPLSYGFSDRALSPQWRAQMLSEYTTPALEKGT